MRSCGSERSPANRKVVWYIQPEDSRTNAAISDMYNGSADEFTQENVRCADMVKRDLWRCKGWEQVKMLIQSKRQIGLKFVIWKKMHSILPMRWQPRKLISTKVRAAKPA